MKYEDYKERLYGAIGRRDKPGVQSVYGELLTKNQSDPDVRDLLSRAKRSLDRFERDGHTILFLNPVIVTVVLSVTVFLLTGIYVDTNYVEM